MEPALIKLREVRRLLAMHPRTPEARAITLVSGLFWRDLVRIGLGSGTTCTSCGSTREGT